MLTIYPCLGLGGGNFITLLIEIANLKKHTLFLLYNTNVAATCSPVGGRHGAGLGGQHLRAGTLELSHPPALGQIR